MIKIFSCCSLALCSIKSHCLAYKQKCIKKFQQKHVMLTDFFSCFRIFWSFVYRATLRGGSLLFTTKFTGIPGSHLIHLGRVKGWINLRATQWSWTWDLWIGNTEPLNLWWTHSKYIIHIIYMIIYNIYIYKRSYQNSCEMWNICKKMCNFKLIHLWYMLP